MRPTAIELRERVVAARIEDGQSMGDIAKRFKIPKGTVQNILKRHHDTGSVLPKPQNPGRKPAFSPLELETLRSDILANPDGTLEEFRARSQVKVSLVAFHNTIKKLGFTRKKNRYLLSSNTATM